MPKITGTNIESAIKKFRETNTLTADELKLAFPSSNIAALVWHLQWRHGMVFTRQKGPRNKIIAYTYHPKKRGKIINGSKRIHDQQIQTR